MCERPFRHFPEEEGLEVDYDDRHDESKVKYSWSGLTFPVRALAENED
jgi:hypothetical protein